MSLNNYEQTIMTLVDHDNTQLEVVTMGDSKSDRAVVLIHGAIMTYKIMTVFAKYLHGVRLIFINCPGRGESTELDRMSHSLVDYATRINEALVSIVNDAKIQEMAIIGYSMGGLIATKLAAYNTLPIKHLVYLNSAAKIDFKELRISKLLMELVKDMNSDNQDGMIKSIPELILDQGISKKQQNTFNFTEYFAPVDAMVTDLLYTLRSDYLADLDEIAQMPDVLFLLGEDDVIFPNKDSKETMEKFEALGANVRSVIYPEVGHLDFLRVLDKPHDGELRSIESNINEWLSIEESDVTE
ncbi:alpha/beta fold hydrolase [Staphylococcus americanisciuri]|uniref:Alpha/beta hydrolase n=1 Tax=Staphylococcus americanisciuri TaxID=2973940 RepID=A0ABT2F3S9_9STAP|nr:alpha/beta hydrolase [Staphylococcus americanisciuri]MCS4487079.1 alpha/beta hydrolase [Staphylococcus americanisciuri]